MATLRAFFHMGRVEWVTCQVPVIESRGGTKVAEDGDGGAPRSLGARIWMLEAAMGATATATASAGIGSDMILERRVGDSSSDRVLERLVLITVVEGSSNYKSILEYYTLFRRLLLPAIIFLNLQHVQKIEVPARRKAQDLRQSEST